MKTLTIRNITPEMKEALTYIKSLNRFNGGNLFNWHQSNNTNTGAIEIIIADWWKNNNPSKKTSS